MIRNVITKTASFLLRGIEFYFQEKWPHPKHSPVQHEPTFLFIFTPPYSGSTALAKVLNSAPSSMMLLPNGEGQWLVPGLRRKDRWQPDKYVDWSSVKAVWMSRVRMVEELVGKVELVVEKSPSNLVRSSQLLKHFPRHEVIVFNRNPYANCASILYRQYKRNIKSEARRMDLLTHLAERWVFRSEYARELINLKNPAHFTYEEFCRNTGLVIEQAISRIPLLNGASTDLELSIKDYAPRKIADQNNRQISQLSPEEKEAIGHALSDHEDLLQFFGYTSKWEEDIEKGGACGA